MVLVSLPLFAAVGLLMMGTGLGSSVLGIRAGSEGFGTAVTGLIMSGYYAGFLVGSLAIPALIERVGHIRVFAGMASLASAAVIVHVVALTPFAWWVLRVLTGLCIAGLFVVSETWLNGAATNRSRGQLLAGYTVVVTGGLAIGQLLLNVASPLGFGAFVLASVLVSIAVVPVSLVSVTAPDLPEPVRLSIREVAAAAPLGAAGALASGFTGAAVVGFGAVYASRAGLTIAQTSVLLFSALVGAIALQFAIGTVADRLDRRLLIAVGTLGAALAALFASLVDGVFVLLVLTTAVAGGMAFPLYSLSNAHLNDHISSGVIVAAGARLVLLNGAGAVAGPLVGAAAIEAMGPEGFFYVLAAVYLATGVFGLHRMLRHPAVTAEERTAFYTMPQGTGPMVISLLPDAADELYPETEGDLEHQPVRIHWRERGTGAPVVLVHDAGSSSRAWSETMLGLADTGHRVIAYDLRGHGASTRSSRYDLAAHLGDLRAILDERDVPVASLVGLGAGAALTAELAAREPSRVSGLVLVSAEQILGPRRRRALRGQLDRIVEGARVVLPRRAVASLRASETYGRRRSPELHRRLATDLRLAGRQAVEGTRAAARHVAETGALERVQARVLWVSASRLADPTVTEHHGAAIVVEHAGYFVPLDQPEMFLDAIAPFLRDTAAAAVAAATGSAHPD